MKFLTDQDVYAVTTEFIKRLGHDVVTASDLHLHQASDSSLLQTAHDQSRILVTRDRDYGGLVFVTDAPAGVIYLRLLPTQLEVVHQELERVLQLYSEEELLRCFCVIEPGRHRLRRL